MDNDRYWYRHYAWYHWWPTTWQGRVATLLSLTPLIGGLVYVILNHPGIGWIVIWISVSLVCLALPLVFFSDRFEMLALQDDYDDKSDHDRAFAAPVADDVDELDLSPEVKAQVLQNMAHSSDDDLKDVY